MFSTVQNAFQQLHDVIVQALHLASEAKQLATLPGIHTVQHHVRHRAIQLCDPLLPELFQLRPPHVRIRRIEAERHPRTASRSALSSDWYMASKPYSRSILVNTTYSGTWLCKDSRISCSR